MGSAKHSYSERGLDPLDVGPEVPVVVGLILLAAVHHLEVVVTITVEVIVDRDRL